MLPTKKPSVQEAVVPEEEKEEYDLESLLKKKKTKSSSPSLPSLPSSPPSLPSPLPKKAVYSPKDMVSASNNGVTRIVGAILSRRKDIIETVVYRNRSLFIDLGDTSVPLVVNDYPFSLERFFQNTQFQWAVRNAILESLKDCHVVFPQNQKEGAFHVLVVRKKD